MKRIAACFKECKISVTFCSQDLCLNMKLRLILCFVTILQIKKAENKNMFRIFVRKNLTKNQLLDVIATFVGAIAH